MMTVVNTVIGYIQGFPGDLVVKNLPAMQEMQVLFLGWEDPLEKETATHSNMHAREMPWAEASGGLQPMGVTKKSDMTQ